MNNALYNQIRIFQSIAREGNISAAARKLEITPPSVSNALRLLEEHIGHPLFVRTTRRIELTETGQQLLEQTAAAVETLEKSLEIIRDQNQEPSGAVRITLSRFAYLLILKPAMAAFCQQYPGIQLEISVYDGTVNIIEERFDLGIRFGDILEGGVVARPLMKPFREGLYASSAYLAEYGVPAMPADLHHHRLIGYRFITNNRILPLILNDHGEQLTVEMPGQLISNDIDVMADGIRHGLGIGRLFEPILQLQPDREQFIPVMEDYWKTYPPVYLYYPKNAGRTKRVKALIDFLIMHAAQ
ncbi:TPA: LysR family transcriptional regulator [Klebsiella pneumoniae]|uniref:LysR family transcriptional regulator n=1 Tax=Klebsiella pneumoniae TaxID=573 RepID=UPI0004974CE1|nr:LysR family transcriptional regulator [Klebsiella pneumoniae]HBY0302907.1 LysR family transcriptional regulator [Klebsiella pneumoniae subsp. pneumoniae]AXT64576.1 LysR family transcriptional regulator [Klebsiella pneumoniae]EJD6389401.1 LysR family transcriptional regulator [Klebsiella pneumoniae]EKJ7644738.1 LysR family transcriptional regulator [Klebsiella pneumoniae]EKT9178099.1 LysR family transcriptional regulator [Klebsiella pneumoniae]